LKSGTQLHEGNLWHLRYKGEDGLEGIVIATPAPKLNFRGRGHRR
jgi:valyl-tRNA synthetase